MYINFMILQRMNKMCIRYIILYSLFSWLPVFAQVQLPLDMHNLAISSIYNVYNEKFKQAEDDAKRIIKKYPNHPAGYFFYAAVLNLLMEYLQSDKYENEFYKYCDFAISKGEDLLEKQPDNAWAKFFIAGANGIKWTYESRYERWLTAFKHGWRAVVMLRELLESNPEMKDALYGIAIYNYWRSAKIKLLWWLQSVEDRRDRAIRMLYDLQNEGTYVKEGSSINLIGMLYNEKRFAHAIEVADKMLTKYPSNLICRWKKAEAQLDLKEFDKAENSYKYILKHIESGSFDGNYNAVLCRYYLLKIYFCRKQYDLCITEYNLMKSFKLSPISQKRLEKRFGDASSMERKARYKLTKKSK